MASLTRIPTLTEKKKLPGDDHARRRKRLAPALTSVKYFCSDFPPDMITTGRALSKKYLLFSST